MLGKPNHKLMLVVNYSNCSENETSCPNVRIWHHISVIVMTIKLTIDRYYNPMYISLDPNPISNSGSHLVLPSTIWSWIEVPDMAHCLVYFDSRRRVACLLSHVHSLLPPMLHMMWWQHQHSGNEGLFASFCCLRTSNSGQREEVSGIRVSLINR